VWVIAQVNLFLQCWLWITAAVNSKDRRTATGSRVAVELFVCINVLLWLNLIKSLSGYFGIEALLLMAESCLVTICEILRCNIDDVLYAILTEVLCCYVKLVDLLVVWCLGIFARLVGCLYNRENFIVGSAKLYWLEVGLGLLNLHLLCIIHFLLINSFAYLKKNKLDSNKCYINLHHI
jgi:hypothetical protein